MNIPNLQTNVPLAPFTTFKIGGPAKFFVVAKTAQDVVQAVQEADKAGEKVFVLGGGSDILVSDEGFDGLVIKLELREVEVDEQKAQARFGAGLLMAGAIAQSTKHGLGGLEYAIGVPATVGGAVWANLGARGSEIADFLVEVTVLDENNVLRVLTKDECEFAYRESVFKHKPYVILDALFQLEPTEKEELRERVKELSEKRNKEQEIGAECAGCVFRNPTDQTDKAAAQLIDNLGLKGKQIGGARVSDVHANFIINTGGATAKDVVMLISYIKQQVRDEEGVQLMEEIEYVGF